MAEMWFNQNKPTMTDEAIQDLIRQNSQVPFVSRLINRHISPVINNPDGSYSTHKMEWSQVGDKYIAYPTIELIDGKLTDLRSAGIDPVKHAIENKNFLAFDSSKEADYFAKNYKRALGIE